MSEDESAETEVDAKALVEPQELRPSLEVDPGPTEDPVEEPVDRHRGPLDSEDDVRWLKVDDPRSLAIAARIGLRDEEATD